jgi:DNA-binding NarL/FixJ family response regulator
MCARRLAPIRVLVADHRRMVRSGIRVMLSEVNAARRFSVVEATCTEDLLQKARTGKYEIFLVAGDLAGRGGIKATEVLTTRYRVSFVLGMLDLVDRRATEQLIHAGAAGCILKSIETETLVAAIRTVIEGRPFYSNDLALAMLDRTGIPEARSCDRLTKRERDLLKAIMRGRRAGEIAAEWGVCKRTVDKHREHLKTKLRVRNMVGLVMAGIAIFG